MLASCGNGSESPVDKSATVSDSSDKSNANSIDKILIVSGSTETTMSGNEISTKGNTPRQPTDGVPLYKSIVGTEIYNGRIVAKRELLVGMNDWYNIDTLKSIVSKYGFIVVAGSQPMYKVDISSWTGTLDTAMALMESNPEIFVANVNRQSGPNTDDDSKQGDVISATAATVLSGSTERNAINTSGDIPFNSAMLVIQSNGLPIDKSTGYIKNQYWVTSESLNASSILELVKVQTAISIVAYRISFGGYLIEYDYDDPVALSQLELLKANHEIRLNQRRYIGNKVDLAL